MSQTPTALLRTIALAGAAMLSTGQAAAQATVDELTSAVAATAVMAFRCEPSAYVRVRDQAFKEMYQRMRLYSQQDQMLAYESAERKLKAFSTSAALESCPGFERLRSVANTWGYGHLIVPAAVPGASGP
jgi:hypothetical protein